MELIDGASEISGKAKIFHGVRVVDSLIGDYCSLGDDSDVGKSTLSAYVQLNKRNLIRSSSIGTGSHTGSNTTVTFAEIGRYCSISWNVSIGGKNHDYLCPSTLTSDWWKKTFDVEVEEWRSDSRCIVGNDVWIGTGALVLSGVTVGDGAVIGGGSVVTHDVPPYAIAAGVPAKIIGWRYPEETRDRLLELAWWNWDREAIRKASSLLTAHVTEETLSELEALFDR